MEKYIRQYRSRNLECGSTTPVTTQKAGFRRLLRFATKLVKSTRGHRFATNSAILSPLRPPNGTKNLTEETHPRFDGHIMTGLYDE
jgi:hypothetical protein